MVCVCFREYCILSIDVEMLVTFFFFKQKTAYEMRISDWSSDVCSSDLLKALAFDYHRFAKRNAALFKGQSGSTADWGQTRRLVVGPFKDRKSAQAWLADYKKAEGDGFLFDSEAGEPVEPLE